MSITAYWRATTGYNVNDYPVVLGKPVRDCTLADLEANPMCGSVSPFSNVAYTATSDEMVNTNIINIGGAAGFTYPITSDHMETWEIGEAPTESIRKQYRRTIFIAKPTSVTISQYCITETIDSRVLIVEDIKDPNKLVINFGNTTDYGDNTFRTVNFSISSACKHTCQKNQTAWSSAPSNVDYEDPDTHTHTYYEILPVWLYTYGDDIFIVRQEFLCFFGGRWKNGAPDTDNYNYIGGNNNFTSFSQTTPKYLEMGYNPNLGSQPTTMIDLFGESAFPDPITVPTAFVNGTLTYPTINLAPDGAGVIYGLSISSSQSGGYRVYRLDINLYTGNQWYRANTMCRAGCYFVNNGELLKPIIQDGIVIGYGTPEQESEIDTYVDLKHPVPSTPGGGGGGAGENDDIDPQLISNGTALGGITNLWLLTAAQMQSFHNAINGADFDVMPSILSVMGLGVAANKIIPDIQYITNIIVKKPDGTTWSSGVSGHIVSSVKGGFSYSNIQIQRCYGDFRDFSPYATHELFIPMCGWVTIPDIAVGRKMTLTYVFDVECCKIRGVVDVDGAIVAEREGIMGCTISMSTTGHGLYVNSAIVNGANLVSSGLSALFGVGTGNEFMTLGATANAANALGNSIINDRINRTETVIGNGSRTGFSDGCWILVKSTYTNSDEPPLYAHTVGYPCNKSGQLSTFSGYTVCKNPHVNINCTNVERDEIKRLLESGVIL